MARAPDDAPVVIWEPQPGPQWDLLSCPVFEVFYGGARGGGKTDGVLGDFASHADLYGDAAIGLMVRRERTQLIETIERSRELYVPLGAKWHEQDKQWRFPNGARLRFAYLERDADAEAYQGHSYSRVYVEEIGNFPDPTPILKLMATLRSAKGVPVGFRATGNPGGPGHAWVKARYIDPAPLGYEIIRDEASGLDRVFIPSKVTDNPLLLARDPQYVSRLRASGSDELVRAWLDGDWSVIQGAFFAEFSITAHVIEPRPLPRHWTRFRAMDWGFARPFSVGWYAVSDGTEPGIAKGALVRYREMYGWSGKPNVGCRLTAPEVAQRIAAAEKGDAIAYGVADPAIFATQDGPSIAERFARTPERILWDRGDNKRVPDAGAMGGWDQVRARLRGDEDGPGLLMFSTCTHLIRTLPLMQHDANRPEDMDTEGEDHAVDELRYACMSRPYVRDLPKNEPARTVVIGGQSTVTMDDVWRAQEEREQEYAE